MDVNEEVVIVKIQKRKIGGWVCVGGGDVVSAGRGQCECEGSIEVFVKMQNKK